MNVVKWVVVQDIVVAPDDADMCVVRPSEERVYDSSSQYKQEKGPSPLTGMVMVILAPLSTGSTCPVAFKTVRLTTAWESIQLMTESTQPEALIEAKDAPVMVSKLAVGAVKVFPFESLTAYERPIELAIDLKVPCSIPIVVSREFNEPLLAVMN